MRGLSLNVCYPISPFTPSPEERKSFFNSMKVKNDKEEPQKEEKEDVKQDDKENDTGYLNLFQCIFTISF